MDGFSTRLNKPEYEGKEISLAKAEGRQKDLEIFSGSPEQTLRLGEVLGKLLPVGFFIGLRGELGAGKTALAKGIARGLGVSDENEVTSPTFVLVNEYRGRFPVYHVDLYRLNDPGELEGIGWEEILSRPAVTLVEWAEKAGGLLPEDRIDIHMEWMDERERRLLLKGRGTGRQIIEDVEERWREEV